MSSPLINYRAMAKSNTPPIDLLPNDPAIVALAFDDTVNECWGFMFRIPADITTAHVILRWCMARANYPLAPPKGYCLWRATVYGFTELESSIDVPFPDHCSGRAKPHNDYSSVRVRTHSSMQEIMLPIRFPPNCPTGMLIVYRDAINKEDTALGDAILMKTYIHWSLV